MGKDFRMASLGMRPWEGVLWTSGGIGFGKASQPAGGKFFTECENIFLRYL